MVERLSDFKMPEKIVTRLLKESLPDNVIVSKDAKNAVCRSASIFILQLSIAAAEQAEQHGRKTLENGDIVKAVIELGLADYAPILVRLGAQRKRNAKRRESSLTKTKSNKKTPSDETEHQDMELLDQDNEQESFQEQEPDLDSQDLPSQDEEEELHIDE